MEVQLFADYCQILLQDSLSELSLADAWSVATINDRMAVLPGLIGIWAEDNNDVDVSINVASAAPDLVSADFDHVVEGSMRSDSGIIVVMGCTDYLPEADRLSVPTDWLRVRVSKSILQPSESGADEFDSDSAEFERIKIDMWPQEQSPVCVLKQWPGQA